MTQSDQLDEQTSNPAVSTAMHDRARFVLFGDSITQQSFEAGGWGARLTARYARKVDVVLRGYSGYNIAWASHLLPYLFPQTTSWDLVTVFFGANDAAIQGGCNGKQHVPLGEFKRLLVATIDTIKAGGARAIVIITPPPVDESARRTARMQKHGLSAEQVTDPDRLNTVTGDYAAVGREVATETGVACVDTWTKFQEDISWHTLLSDGLHLSPAGNEALYKLLQHTLDTTFPQLRFDSLPYDFPLHDDILGSDPGAAFKPSANNGKLKNGETE